MNKILLLDSDAIPTPYYPKTIPAVNEFLAQCDKAMGGDALKVVATGATPADAKRYAEFYKLSDALAGIITFQYDSRLPHIGGYTGLKNASGQHMLSWEQFAAAFRQSRVVIAEDNWYGGVEKLQRLHREMQMPIPDDLWKRIVKFRHILHIDAKQKEKFFENLALAASDAGLPQSMETIGR